MTQLDELFLADESAALSAANLRAFVSGVRPMRGALVPVFSTRDARSPALTVTDGDRRRRQRFRLVDDQAIGSIAVVLADGAFVTPSTLGFDLFGLSNDETLDGLRLDAVDTLITALSVPPLIDRERADLASLERSVDHAMNVAFGAGILARTARELILDRPMLPQLPGELLRPFGDLSATGCFGKIRAAGTAYRAAQQRATVTPIGSIESIEPPDACEGQSITVRGTGFGSSGLVSFTTHDGYRLVAAAKWADAAVEVTVPMGAISGPFGLYPAPDPASVVDLDVASTTLFDSLGGCLGPVVAARLAGIRAPLAAPALVIGTGVRFEGGSPVIRSFTVNGASRAAACRPGQRVVVAWEVEGATSVRVTPSGSAPAVQQPGPGAVRRGSLEVVMPHGTWAGTYTLEATNSCTTQVRPVDISVADKVAFALGGGGARGDFQLGALRYLAERGVRPDALATTSVGSVNGVQLAHGNSSATTAQAELERIWLQLASSGDFFTLSATATAIRQKVEAVLPSLIGSTAVGAGVGAAIGLVVLGPLGLLIGLLTGAIAGGAAGVSQLVSDLLPLINSIMSDRPPIAVALPSGQTITIGPASGIYTLAPIRQKVDALVDVGRVANSGIELRLVSVALDNSRVVAVDEQQRIWMQTGSRRRLELTADTAPLADGVMASASMPSIFEHQSVGPFTCVDGGVRDVVPVRVAIYNLGASTVYAIACSAPTAPRAGAANMSMLSVFGRAVMDIPFDEIGIDDTEPYGGWPIDVVVHLIRPTFNVHDTMVVEPGLIRIAIDYGWMRAADVVDGPAGREAGARVQCDTITKARVQAWRLEHYVYGQPFKDPDRDPFSHLFDGGTVTPPTDLASTVSAAQAVRSLKVQVRDACRQRMAFGAALPAASSSWFTDWEFHGAAPVAPLPPFAQQGWIPPDATPWSNLAMPGGTLAAATPPTP
jgi:NTE family protein